jgi:hypothetical protein
MCNTAWRVHQAHYLEEIYVRTLLKYKVKIVSMSATRHVTRDFSPLQIIATSLVIAIAAQLRVLLFKQVSRKQIDSF